MKPNTWMILLIFFCAIPCSRVHAREGNKLMVIAIEFIGASDKPIIPIVLATSREEARAFVTNTLKRNELELTYVHVVNMDLLNLLAQAVDDIRDSEKTDAGASGSESPVKCLQLSIVGISGKRTLQLDLKDSRALLDRFKTLCGEDRSLYSDLAHFQVRLKH
jgi:hypothetical protein